MPQNASLVLGQVQTPIVVYEHLHRVVGHWNKHFQLLLSSRNTELYLSIYAVPS